MSTSILKKKIIIQFLVIAILIFFLTGIAFAQKTFLSFGTGGTGGVYYPVLGGMAELVNRNIPNVEATAEVTGASLENIRLMDNGEVQIALANAGPIYFAYNGTGIFDKKYEILAMFNMYPSTLQFIALKDSGINSVKDFKGKRVCVGPPGGNTYEVTYDMMDHVGLTKDDITESYLTFIEGVQAMKDGLIDVLVVLAGAPSPAAVDISSTRDIKIVPVEKEILDNLEPYYRPGKIDAGTYKGVDEDVPSVFVWNVIFCSDDFDEDLAYQLTKLWYENKDYLVNVHPILRYMDVNVATEVPIPMHPGAEKYFKEVGVIK